MTILGIANRTENWKTATAFAPLLGQRSVELAKLLLGEEADLQPSDVHLELFWRGLRDHLHQEEKKLEDQRHDLAVRFLRLFGCLRRDIDQSHKFRKLTDDNYSASTDEQRRGLATNLRNTEMDIVLSSPDHLFVGEAKHEATFGADSSNVLAHQLIRQYVTASILVDLRGRSESVVPFVVGDSGNALRRSHQVQFMIERGWMRAENVLEWGAIEALGA